MVKIDIDINDINAVLYDKETQKWLNYYKVKIKSEDLVINMNKDSKVINVINDEIFSIILMLARKRTDKKKRIVGVYLDGNKNNRK